MADPPSPTDPRDAALVTRMAADSDLRAVTHAWFIKSCEYRYSYNFRWLGVPIIQYPQDILALQEIVWQIRPDLIVETGIAHGGSLVLYASLLELIGSDGLVVGIDIDIRAHNREILEHHPMSRRIRMVEGSSTDEAAVETVANFARGRNTVLVALDSSHTHNHVARELRLYAPLVTSGSYLIVFDTVVEDLPAHCIGDRPWSRGNSPKTAVREFLAENDEFEIDREIQDRLLITVAPDGFLRRVKDRR